MVNNEMHQKVIDDLKTKLEELEPGSKEYREVYNWLMEIESRKEELKNKKWEKIQMGFNIGMPVASLVIYVAMFYAGLKFEEEGAVKSHFVRNLLTKCPFGFKKV